MDVDAAVTRAAERRRLALSRISPRELWKACDGDCFRALDAAITVTRLRREEARARMSARRAVA